jgi:ribosomal-protein-alanine N-acetyltransferase
MPRMHSGAITLRLAGRGDSNAIAAMSRDLVEAGLGWTYRPERIRRLIGNRESNTLLACDASGPVGFAVMQFSDERAHLILMAVRASHQRRGVGREMLQWLIESAVVAGSASVHLELRAGNRSAIDFYRALGFSQTLLVSGYYQGRENALRMIRVLRPPQMPANDAWLSALRR